MIDRNRIANEVILMLESHLETTGDSWILPSSVNAYVNTQQGSDAWRNTSEQYSQKSIDYVGNRLIEKYIVKFGRLRNGKLPKHIEQAVEEFELNATFEALVLLAEKLDIFPK